MEIEFTYTKSFLFLILKMEYWHLESYLNHTGDSIKVSLERKSRLIQANEKLGGERPNEDNTFQSTDQKWN